MAEEIDDNEFFKQDFTTASEWEIFNARLDEIFLDWKLPYRSCRRSFKKNELFLTSWETRSENIFFADVEMIVTYYKARIFDEEEEKSNLENEKVPSSAEKTSPESQSKECQTHLDLMNFANNFCIYEANSSRIHPLAMWYGLREFVVIEMANGSLLNESQFKVLLSSACISVNESNTDVPVFIRVMEKHLDVFLGVSESPSIRINFSIVALEKTPPTCRYLSDLLCMFKVKIKNTYLDPTAVTVSVQLTYSLKDFANRDFFLKCKIPFSSDLEDSPVEEVKFKNEGTKFCVLPYGVSIDPIEELVLHCTWQEISENVVIDSATYSELKPMLAPLWSIRINIKNKRNIPIYYLTDALEEFLKLHENNKRIGNILGSSYDVASSQNFIEGNPLNLLTESKIPNLKSVLEEMENKKKSKKKKQLDGPLKEKELIQMLYYMFPDAQSESEYPYDEFEGKYSFDPWKIKSAIPDSLLFRLSSLLATVNMYFSGLSAVAQLWAEFTQEMRYRVERCIEIPGVAPGFPDSRTCLLHQKLQMLNICMERRRVREGNLPFSMIEKKGIRKNSMKKDEDSDEEFYDCDDDNDNKDSERHELYNKPEGRLEKLNDLTLIDSDEALYIPITQDPVPKTEDQLHDDAEVMLKLGPGSELCAQMMTASLLSDMESFKAANPSGKLEDFIRWYSPRDWIVETNENGETIGQLSQRMQIPGNTWQTVWKQAKPVPARRQKRLFDDTKEAEKVLHFLETRTIGQICELTISTLFHSAIIKLQDELSNSQFSEFFKDIQDKFNENLCKISREPWNLLNEDSALPLTIPSPKKWELLLNEMMILERSILHSRSIIYKLFNNTENLNDNQKEILKELLKGYDAELNGGAKNLTSVEVLSLFSESRELKNEFNTDKDAPTQLFLPEPVCKEYILRVNSKTTTRGVCGPQFLRAILDKNMRLCGAFSENTTFV
ncbi:rab3 GTPase-activating protein catalytic subunit [Condylostylus longicornis]|uniref:rab3 GTPase-activating protein catalytic subunit n=1 Tax=Condylostylus longicornis TaxID=2530218 RepID=UPI00244E0185|nr:rab3 GTPase-activating protein catalytic subunit [Condylostylus longicornis]